MSPLARSQEAFLACILDDCAPLPAGWNARHAAGMEVYRNAYRGRLIDVLRNTYERTLRLVGDEAFEQAAAHHLIMNPPRSWTVDLAGKGFAETCDILFAGDPDVGELAWLEWAMHTAFTAADRAPMDFTSFAEVTAGFGAEEWDALCLDLIPSVALRQVTFDIAGLWRGLAHPDQLCQARRLESPEWLLVWREDDLPVFCLVPWSEGQALSDIQLGVPFGQACANALDDAASQEAAEAVGAMLQDWLQTGLIETVRTLACNPKLEAGEPRPWQ